MNTKYYKVLDKNGKSCHGGNATWSLPIKNDDGTWVPGDWMPEIEGELIPCTNGYHLCKDKQVLSWLREAIYEAEYQGECIEHVDKIVVRKVRLLRKLEGWNIRTFALFAADCAEHILHIYEERYPGDDRPRKAIEAARNGDKDAAAHAADAADAVAHAVDAAHAAFAAERDWQYKRFVDLGSGKNTPQSP